MFVFGGDVITCARYRPSWGSVLSVSVHAVLHKLCNSPSCTSSSSAKNARNVFFFRNYGVYLRRAGPWPSLGIRDRSITS